MNARILLVEDSPSQGALVKAGLEEKGYEVIWVQSGIEALKQARLQPPDLVLLDLVLGDMDGFSVCRWLKLHDETRDVPVIMLTVRSSVEDRVEGLHVGADDYLPKPFNNEELEARLFAALRVKTAQTDLKKRNAQLESMLHHMEALAVTDPLSGLFNRRRFADVLRREFALTKRYKNELSCILLDLDLFKRINDRYGHEAGDTVLQEVSRAIVEGLREVDVPARYGGEEFVILLPHTNRANASIVAERLRKRIADIKFQFETDSVQVTASFGVASVSDTLGPDDADRLVKRADQALYHAKAQGRDCVVVWAEDTGAPCTLSSLPARPGKDH